MTDFQELTDSQFRETRRLEIRQGREGATREAETKPSLVLGWSEKA